jgi:hypothetical protein
LYNTLVQTTDKTSAISYRIKSLTLAKAVFTPEVLARHAIQEQMVHTRQAKYNRPAY